MSKTILIRSLSEKQSQNLENIKEFYQEKTNSKAIQQMIDRHLEIISLLKESQSQLKEEKNKNKLLEAFKENVKWELSLLNEKE
jgi:predicted outer membrane protein